jgi:predicted nucleic acid-binding protein
MSSWVVDASVALKWFLPEPGTEKAAALLSDVERGEEIIAPDLILLEVASALRKRVKKAELSKREAGSIVRQLTRARLHLLPSREITQFAFEIASSIGCSVYDAAYLAVAAILERPLVTADAALVRLSCGGGFENLVVLLDEWPPKRS